MFHIIKDPLQIEPDIELQIEVVQNNPDLSDKEKMKQIKKLKKKQIKQMLSSKGGIN